MFKLPTPSNVLMQQGNLLHVTESDVQCTQQHYKQGQM